jgi:hypothetical protein
MQETRPGITLSDMPEVNPFILEGDLTIWVNKIIAWLIVIAVIAAIGYIIYAGLVFITSGGQPEKYEKALKTIGHTILGLFVVFAAVAIVAFVAKLFGFDFVTHLIDFSLVWHDIQDLIQNLTGSYSGRDNLEIPIL